MRDTTRRFKVGLIVLGCGFMFMSLVLFILGSSLNSKLVTYDILFDESVKGMVIGSKVNFQGIPVGSVTDIRFRRGKTKVEISIDSAKAEIQDVTVARMDRLMITGQVTIELEGYKSDGKPIPRGGLIPARMSAFDEFAQSLPEVVGDVDDLLISLNVLVDRLSETLDEDNQRSLKETLANINVASKVFADRLEPLIEERLGPALTSMETNFAKLGAVAESKDLAAALDSVSGAMRRVDRIEAELLSLIRDVRGIVGGTRRTFVGTLTTARDALSEIKKLAHSLRMAPSALMFGRAENEIQVPATPDAGKK